MTRLCAFCGGRPLTREHVMPQWLTNVLPEQARFRGQDQQVILMPPGGGESSIILPHREVKEPFNAITVKAVCRNCNNGWMNGVEGAARPALSPLIRGEPVPLERDSTISIATWAVKTALMAQLTSVEGLAALSSVYRAFHHDRQPPDNSVVWAAAVGSEDWALRYEIVSALIATEEDRDSLAADDPVNTLSVTLGIGHLLLHTVLTARSEVSYPPLDDIHQGAVVRLWPVREEVIDFPAHWLMNETAWAISRSFAIWHSLCGSFMPSSQRLLALGWPGAASAREPAARLAAPVRGAANGVSCP